MTTKTNKSSTTTNTITLIPGNWLYNAGAIGFLRVLESCNDNVESYFSPDGSITIGQNDLTILKDFKLKEPFNKFKCGHWHFIHLSFFWFFGSLEEFIRNQILRIKKGTNRSEVTKKISEIKRVGSLSFTEEEKHIKTILKSIKKDLNVEDIEKAIYEITKVIQRKYELYIYRKTIGALFSSGGFYQNWLNPSHFSNVDKFLEILNLNSLFACDKGNLRCEMCGENRENLKSIDFRHLSYLFPAPSFPNSFWNNNTSSIISICSKCLLLIMHHHLGLIKLNDGSTIFINAPSFHVMWHLNNYARQMLSRTSSAREVLGLSLIEYTLQTQKHIHKWTAHNVEVVVKRGKEIEFIQLPAEVVKVLNNSRIANLLKELKELTILNKVLDMQFDWLLESAQHILRIAIKDQDNISDNDTKFIKKIFPYLSQKEELSSLKRKKTRKNLTELAHKMLLLYSVIKESLPKSTAHV